MEPNFVLTAIVTKLCFGHRYVASIYRLEDPYNQSIQSEAVSMILLINVDPKR